MLAFGEALPVSEDKEIQEQHLRGDIIIKKEGPINIVVSVKDEINDEIIDPKGTGGSFAYKLYSKTPAEEIIPEELFVPLKEYRKEARDAAAKANGRSTVHDEIIDVELDADGFPHELHPKKRGKEALTQVLFVPLNEAIKDLRDLAVKRVEKSQVHDEIIDVELDGDGFPYQPYPKDPDEGNIPEEFSAQKEDPSEEAQGVTIAKVAENSEVHDEIINVDVDGEGFPFLSLAEKPGEETRPDGVFVPKEDSSEETLGVTVEPKGNGDEQAVLVSGTKGVSRNTGEISFTKVDAPLVAFADPMTKNKEEEVFLQTTEKTEKETFPNKETRDGVHGREPIIVMSPRDYNIPVTVPGEVNYSKLRLLPPIRPPPEMTTMGPQGKNVMIPNRTRFSEIFKPVKVDSEESEVKYEEVIFAEDFKPLEEDPEEDEEEYSVEIDIGDYKSVEVDPREEYEGDHDPLRSVSWKEPFTVMRVSDDIVFPMEIDPEETEEESEEELDPRKQSVDPLDYFYSSEASDDYYYDVPENDQDPYSFPAVTLSQEPEDSRDLTFDYSPSENLLEKGRLKFLSRQIRKEFERSYPFKAAPSRILPLPLHRHPKYPLALQPWLHPVHF